MQLGVRVILPDSQVKLSGCPWLPSYLELSANSEMPLCL